MIADLLPSCQARPLTDSNRCNLLCRESPKPLGQGTEVSSLISCSGVDRALLHYPVCGAYWFFICVLPVRKRLCFAASTLAGRTFLQMLHHTKRSYGSLRISPLSPFGALIGPAIVSPPTYRRLLRRIHVSPLFYVPETGLEPALPEEPVPKTGVSTNSTIRAWSL